MDRLEYIDDFVDEVDKAGDLESVFAALRKQINRLEFEHFTYVLMWPENGPKEPLYYSTYPKEWVDRYVKKKYASNDMVTRQAVRVMRPFLWQEISHNPYLTKDQRVVFDESREFHIRDGACVPIHGPGTSKALLTVAGDMDEPIFAKLFLSRRHEIHIMATYAHERIIQLGVKGSPEPDIFLTPREIEILTWAARGKTRWEIGEIVGISEDTVKNHLDHCRLKLNASNNTHATAIALFLGLILP